LKVNNKSKSWDYTLNGSDWAKDYPQCALPKQSPINFIDPQNDYGQAYDIYSYNDDNH